MEKTDKYAKLDALYATLPKINCKRECGFTNCGPIQCTALETQRVEERVGFVRITDRSEWQKPTSFLFRQLPYHLPKDEFYRSMVFWEPDMNGTADCQFLRPIFGTCRVYALRPLICRLWGLVDHPAMRCRFGCIPERWITAEEGREYYRKTLEIEREE